MKVLTIITMQLGSEQAHVWIRAEVPAGTSRTDLLEHLKRDIVARYGSAWNGANITFFYCELDTLGEPLAAPRKNAIILPDGR